MKQNFKDRLQSRVIKEHDQEEIQFFKRLYSARQQVLRAIKQAQDALSRVGYHFAVVTDTGSMISAKLFSPSINRDFSKSRGELLKEEGFPINLQISIRDNAIVIYSYPHAGGPRPIVSSNEMKKVQDAIITELEEQISLGVQYFKNKRR
jgi:hypothetical protein